MATVLVSIIAVVYFCFISSWLTTFYPFSGFRPGSGSKLQRYEMLVKTGAGIGKVSSFAKSPRYYENASASLTYISALRAASLHEEVHCALGHPINIAPSSITFYSIIEHPEHDSEEEFAREVYFEATVRTDPTGAGTVKANCPQLEFQGGSKREQPISNAATIEASILEFWSGVHLFKADDN